jgi:cyclophilin family peptidyl-prolyl cis-trans isomerase
MMKKYVFFLVAILFLISTQSCDHKNDYDQPILTNSGCQNIIGLQDKRDAKALIPYFVNNDYLLREQATLAFGSVTDTAALNSLYTMLEEDEPIAQAAAFAVGQIGHRSSVEVIQRLLERSMLEETRFEFFDAMGKCGDIELNYYLASTYNVGKDAKGTAWALMELANNKKLNPAGIQLAITLLENESVYETRLAAAHAIARSGLDVPTKKIEAMFMAENLEDVKMALAKPLNQMPASEINKDLIDNIIASFYLTQINALRAFNGKKSILVDDWVNQILRNDANINLKITAAQYLNSVPGNSTPYLKQNIANGLNWRVRTILYQDAIKNNNESVIEDAYKKYDSTINLYEKGMLLEALGQLPGNKEWLIDEISSNDSIVSTYGMEGMVNLINHSDKKGTFAPYLYESLNSNHDAVVSLTAIAFRDNVFKDIINVQLLINRQSKLKLPRQSEAYLELEKTIRMYTGKEGSMPLMNYNHPIDLSRLAALDTLKGFVVKTTKGDLFMTVYPDEAPGTVQTIKDLVDQGYYNNKLFHRVVPNFVAQTGCPDGDGWGSLNFTIRSEFSKLRYFRGSVGMASAGKDTESCQWFISLSPTPHLNGRYTLFAEITQGMEVVDVLEIGDRILSMESVYM